MTRTFYFEHGAIAEERDGEMTWLAPLQTIQAIAVTQGPNECFTDSDTMIWTGDDFWRYSGDLCWRAASR